MQTAYQPFETDDLRLTNKEVGELQNVHEIIGLFMRMNYDVKDATVVGHAALGIDDPGLQLEINEIWRIGTDRDLGDIVIYLMVVKSVSVTLVQKVAQRFRTRPELALLVLTTEFEKLDFVLLDQVQERRQAKNRLSPDFRQRIRPRLLTVDRRNPASLAVRVLRRFTYTEGDSNLQWEKLRSAFTLAEWSEEYFNNRALFSDYYLKQRLTDQTLTPEWEANVLPVGGELFKLVPTARQTYSGQPETVMRTHFYEPIFKLLGFDFTAVKPGNSNGIQPDYLLYAPGNHDKPLAAALTYVWNRNLDTADLVRDQETSDEIPGALVVSTLEAGAAPWIIATNGKLWRLYSAAADNKATNYYEVDLEEAFSAHDRIMALKYWWLFFRSEAFDGFLDDLRRFSAEYAKELGERLKNHVFEDIFPHFAAGLIADMRRQGEPLDLTLVFQATLTFLYRLMFVAYAESLDLLPLYEERGYGELSLRKLKHEVAAIGGTIEDLAPKQLAAVYSDVTGGLYARLQALFRAIDGGEPALNLPTYNGGLFSAETEGGRLLARCSIPDRFLTLGLDRLCRDVDSRTHALVPIDFKSLGVRQLGSIYEGLLEFKLQIAPEQLAVIRENVKEVYVPSAKAKGKKVLAVLEPDDVYLQNDKRERKATGSYYTPDYIVKYIVEHAVGPVLDRKFAELEPRLRAAQKRYRDARTVALQKKEDPEKFWNNEDMRELADACLDVKVLDPAMGSGHFLVEAVDYISDRLIVWLNGWSDNPVWALLERTRRDILEDMERQRVTIPQERLVRVALLKRAVLKRCIYGVDLNGMAVELAKVSLWLDAFTLGAPLSFLDHHLKQGNSLVGSWIADVQAALLQSGQSSLFASSKFTGVMLATDLMRQVSFLSDTTVDQVASSRTAYHSAIDHLAPYKRVLDVYTSRWFGNGPTKRGFEPALELLKRDDVQKWLEHPEAESLPPEDYMDSRRVSEVAISAATDKHFFHWELEFPEVFFAPSQPGGQDVLLQEGAGFDVVVGNPPWGADLSAEERRYCFDNFETKSGEAETHLYMTDQALNVANQVGRCAFITPNSWLTQARGKSLRSKILGANSVIKIQHLRKEIFADVPDIVPVIFILSRAKLNYLVKIEIADPEPQPPDDIIAGRFWRQHEIDQNVWAKHKSHNFNIFRSNETQHVCEHIEGQSDALNKHYSAIYGIRTGNNVAYLRESSDNGQNLPALVNASEIGFYEISWSGRFLDPTKLLTTDKLSELSKPKIIVQYTRKLSMPDRIKAAVDLNGEYVPLNRFSYIIASDVQPALTYLMAILSSSTLNFYHAHTFIDYDIKPTYLQQEPIFRISFSTESDRRAELIEEARRLYSLYLSTNSDDVLALSANCVLEGKTDIVHDLLAFLAKQMIVLNKDKQAEARRFLGWVEDRLAIIPKNESSGIESLMGKSILNSYFGDYQKDEPERTWEEFYFRLYQSRNRFRVSLNDVKGEIEREFEASLTVLRPIKQQLGMTDTLIDKIVYQLYGLTDAEIEVIERPQYEHSLADAKQAIVQNKSLSDEERAELLAARTLTAGQRLRQRLNLSEDEAALTAALPGVEWLTPEAKTFLIGAEYDLRTRPEQLDFSQTVLAYSKAVEQMIGVRLFARFRDNSSATAADCRNELLQKFMNGAKPPTLSVISDILRSNKEVALRSFGDRIYVNSAERIFGDNGVAGLLADKTAIELRNRAAHDTVLARNDALKMRDWAMNILRLL